MLQQLVADGSLWPVNGTAFAVTPRLREAYAEGDDDELADVALREAALASLRLLAIAADEAPATRRRHDARCWSPTSATSTSRPDLDDAVVRLPGPVSTRSGDRRVRRQCRRRARGQGGIEVIDAADLGDEDADLTVGDAQDHDLAWYANQELPFLLELL